MLVCAGYFFSKLAIKNHIVVISMEMKFTKRMEFFATVVGYCNSVIGLKATPLNNP